MMSYVYATLIVLGGMGGLFLAVWLFQKWIGFCYDRSQGSYLGVLVCLSPVVVPIALYVINSLAQGLGQ